ncbi:DUF924 family protein [Paracoccus siganidrum]|uniref:DUF924 domain-containing protein n=1 Tax=Paracoccus siganidrum TaxID=1276757 RepID=A0A419A3J7_9RHOB|nr:DUF924 family protein [Paracoccus siganidrum]RJL07801.1 DUF924 domain-containing protein [Paracoccus siganidrum]RMC41216.1 DUF924 domain-containing protein [Paracoccus siganidrum]
MTVKSAAEVHAFWFSDEMRPNWFVKSDAVDRRIAEEFGPTYEAAHRGELDGWAETPQDALALVVVLDQFPRNMFRGDPRSFESNDLAVKHARLAVDRGFDAELDVEGRQFLYLPFEHSEELGDQDRSVALYEALGDADALDYAHQHRDIIARFGRFPHRNKVLGREDTPEEAEFLKTHTGF